MDVTRLFEVVTTECGALATFLLLALAYQTMQLGRIRTRFDAFSKRITEDAIVGRRAAEVAAEAQRELAFNLVQGRKSRDA